jgi:hypothetical protein
LIDALSANDEAAALTLLQQAPAGSRLAWVRDGRSGGYPAHVAAWHGLGQFVKQLVELHGELFVQCYIAYSVWRQLILHACPASHVEVG